MERCRANECCADHFIANQPSIIASSCFTVFLCFAVPLITCSGLAQSTDEVHIVPRNPIDHAIQVPPPESPASDPALNAHTRPLRADVDLVLIPATVTDGKNRPVTDLHKQDFTVYEENEQQVIRNFSTRRRTDLGRADPGCQQEHEQQV